MPSKKPRLWLYVDIELKSALAEYAQEKGFNNEQAAAVSILKRWHDSRRSEGEGALQTGSTLNVQKGAHSQGGRERQGVINGAQKEHSHKGAADWAPEIERLRNQVGEQMAGLRAEVETVREGFDTVAKRLDALLARVEQGDTAAAGPTIQDEPHGDFTADEAGTGSGEAERDKSGDEPTTSTENEHDPEGEGNTATGVTDTPQGVTPTLTTSPARRRGRPNRSAAVEARGDLIFDGLLRVLALAETERASAVLALAKAERAYQEGAYQLSDGSAPNWNTILKTNVALIKERLRERCPVHAVAHPETAEAVTALVEQWCRVFSEVLKDETERVNRQYQAGVAERAAAPVAVDISELLKAANHTLLQAKDGAPVRWEAVSVALGIATGRRMAEVHSSATLAPAAHHSLRFSGQLKTREGTEAARAWAEQPNRTIPTLVEAELVLAGLQWLQEHGHRVESVDDVNPRFAQRLSKFLLGMNTRPKLTYKNLRDLYVSACYKNALEDGQAPESLQSIGQNVLGHGPLSGGATASYMKFTLARESISRI